jgi:NAD-dependent DNA ligase
VRARSLYGKGYKKLSDLKNVSADELSAVPQIGKTLAKEILDQLSGKIHEEKIKTFAAEMLETS